MIDVTVHEDLRRQHYNAEVVAIEEVHSDLRIFRLRCDDGPVDFDPGQYTVLGLGYWEPRLPETQTEELTAEQEPQLIRRAYSIGARLLDDEGRLLPVTHDPLLEIYVTLVRQAPDPPALTPRLFMLNVGDRLYVSPKAHGHYGATPIDPDHQVVLIATGTGEAPHNAMLTKLLHRGHRGRIIIASCVRYRRDLGYLAKHRELERQFPNYRYLALTTREPENVDPTHPAYVGKRYLQDYFESGDFERDAELQLDPRWTQVFLCGSPDMIGVPIRTHDPVKRYPTPRGMVEILENRGFEIDRPHHPGNIHFEKYW